MNNFSMTQSVIAFEKVVSEYEPNAMCSNSHRLLLEALADFRKSLQASSNVREGFNALSERQKEIVDLLVAGNTNDQIAIKLCLTEGTIRSHLRTVYNKCGVQNKAQLLVAYYAHAKK